MNDSRTRVFALARHEFRSATRSRVLVSFVVIMMIATFVSVYVASVDYRSQLADYETYRHAAQANGLIRIAPSPLAPLSLLRAAMEYLEIIGAVIAITLGYMSVARERGNGTLPLVRSRPVTGSELAVGNVLGATAIFVILTLSIAATSVLAVGLIGDDWVTGIQLVKLLLAFVAAIVYLTIFYGLGVFATSRAAVPINGLMVALGVWLLVVVVLPQIGDTLDADNQIPGGLFGALGLGHDGEVAILAQHPVYEHIRTAIEELSIAKHFERFTFAMMDVKVRDRGLSLAALLLQKSHDVMWLSAYLVVTTLAFKNVFKRRPSTTRRSRLTRSI